MIVYILKRLASIALTFTVVSVIVFLMMHAVPGGPFDGNDMPVSDEVKAKLNASLGLDRPLYVPIGTGVSVIVFLMMHADPGGPFDGNDMPVSDEVKAKLNAALGLDRPLYV